MEHQSVSFFRALSGLESSMSPLRSGRRRPTSPGRCATSRARYCTSGFVSRLPARSALSRCHWHLAPRHAQILARSSIVSAPLRSSQTNVPRTLCDVSRFSCKNSGFKTSFYCFYMYAFIFMHITTFGRSVVILRTLIYCIATDGMDAG